MSWFSGSSVPVADLDNKIIEATSESIPNGELDLAIALEITDLIRSKKIPPKQCMRSLKKRLTTTHHNPNLLMSTLKLVDLCVKNGGYHFLVELTSKEFIDYLIDYIFKVHYDTKDVNIINNEAKYKVGELILSLIKDWKIFFENQFQLNYVEKCYNQLVHQGYVFPYSDSSLNSKFIDSDAPPEWVDSDECMICYNPFSMINRKHHCRSCGGVFCQTHSSHTSPLVSLGITEPVRVCDNCYERIKSKNSASSNKGKSSHRKSSSRTVDEDDEGLRKAIELSLQESSVPVSRPDYPPPQSSRQEAPQSKGEEEDEELKAAIAASLKEFQEQEKYKQQEQQDQPSPIGQQSELPQSDFYSNILPFEQQPQFSVPNPSVPSSHVPAAQSVEKYSSQIEDLTQQEEEHINLFITLMNQIKNDSNKQANILYDSDLSELHSKIIQLKPKLNKSLRVSIEKYESFLELNNKISTITKLYDQFLESKLSLAYGNHNMSTSTSQPNYFSPYPVESSQQYLKQQPSGYSQQQQTGYSNLLTQQSTDYNNRQPSSYNMQQQNSSSFYPTYPESGSVSDSDREKYYASNPEENKSSPTYQPPQPDGPLQSEDRSQASYSYPIQKSQLSYPEEDSSDLLPSQPGNSQPSYPPQSAEPETLSYPVYPPQPFSSEATVSSYPNYTTSVHAYSPRSTSPDDKNDLEQASVKFPPIEKVELDCNNSLTKTTYPAVNKLPSLPSLPNFDNENSNEDESKRKSKFVPEPEPLIEL